MRKKFLLGLLFAVTSLTGFSAVPTDAQTELVEFYNKSLDHYFVTIEPVEIANLDSGKLVGWERTGYRFPVVKSGATTANTTPVCRFYGRPEAGIDSHFYSSRPEECEAVKVKFEKEWLFESPEVFRAFAVDPNTGNCPTDTSPVYRLWNKRADVNHRYTNQLSVYNAMIAKGYVPEGDGNPLQPVAFCEPTGGAVVPPPPAGSPSCTITGSTSTPLVNSTLTLTAVCSSSPTAYVWSGCTSTSNTCQVTRTTAGAASYSVAGTNAQGTGAPVTQAVTWSAAGALPICTITPSSTAPTNGTTLTLTSNCSQTPTRIDWLECNYLIQQICAVIPTCSSTATSCAVSSNTAGFARYAIAGANASGTGPRQGVDVEWKAATSGGGGGPPGGGGNVFTPVCSALASDENPLIGQSIVLSASCANNPTSYSWTGVTCSQVQCSTSSAATGLVTYTVTASNSAGTSSPSSVNVNWGGVNVPLTPACTLTASNTTPTVGQTVVITSSCTNSPSIFEWTGCNSTGPTCSDTLTTAAPKVYALTATNGVGSGSASITVTWQAAPTAAPVCTVASSSPTAFIGQPVTLTATCSNAPQFYAWTNCASTSATCVATAGAAGPQVYSVQAANTIGASVWVNTTVTWQQSTGGADFCGAYPNVSRVSKGWEDNGPIYTQSNGGFANDGVFVVAFTVPSSPASYGSSNHTDIAEYNGVPTYRQMTLSKSACDFRGIDSSGANGPYTQAYGNSASITWNVGAAPVALTPGQTYYFNFRNYSPDLNNGLGGVSCATSSCNAVVQMNFPR